MASEKNDKPIPEEELHLIHERHPNLEESAIEQIWDVFCLFDSDGNGHIDQEELANMTRALGQNPTEEELDDMICNMDLNEDGKVQFHEFVNFHHNNNVGKNPKEELREAFARLDINKNGKIRIEHLRCVFRTFTNIEENEVNEIIASVDKGQDEICYEDFIELWMEKY